MIRREDDRFSNLAIWILIVFIGIIVITPIIDKYSSKMYKSSLKKEKIDFDNIEPIIIPKDKA